MKAILVIILSIAFCNITFSQKEFSKEKINWLAFNWNDEETKDIILLTTKLDTLQYNFNWQLDTGSPLTFLNGGTWNIFTQKFPYLNQKIKKADTAKLGNYYKIYTPEFLIDDKQFLPNIIYKNDDMGGGFPIDLLDKYKGFAIGTIGLDMFRDKVLILDFKENKIGYTDGLSQNFYMQVKQQSDFKVYKNRIVVPVQIGNQTISFMYDCGASMFTLQTTPKNATAFAPAVLTDTLHDINNGETGQLHNVAGGKINKPVKILGKKYNDIIVYVENGESGIFDEAKVAGIIGNKLFLNHIVVIDFKKGKISLLD